MCEHMLNLYKLAKHMYVCACVCVRASGISVYLNRYIKRNEWHYSEITLDIEYNNA